jgi:serine/threonine-protein kinase
MRKNKKRVQKRLLQRAPDNAGRGKPKPVFEAPDGALEGSILAKQYRLIDVLKRGGMGVVYRARQRTVKREVAVKILQPQFAADEHRVRRFEAEASILGRLRHPNTIRLYDCGRLKDGRLFLVTELLFGESLRDLLARGPLPIPRALAIADQICASLIEAHAHGFIHRDLKADNIFLDRVGQEDHVKVLDFGIAKQLNEPVGTMTPAGELVIGTPDCMAPEQIAGATADARSDVYALGILIHHMITGALPFQGDTPIEVLFKHVRDRPPPLSVAMSGLAVPPPLETLVGEMLEKAPEARPQSMEDVRHRLKDIAASASPVSLSVQRVQRGLARQWRDPFGRWGLVFGALGLALFLALRLFVAPALADRGSAHVDESSARPTLAEQAIRN